MLRQRVFLLSISLLIALVAIVFISGRVGFWSLGGVSVQVFDSATTLFDSQGILVCAPGGAWGIPQASKADLSYLRIVPTTRILDQRTSFSPRPARGTDLHQGQRLRVWTSGSALFSYPVQVSAERVVIEDDGQPTALDCQWRGLAL
jgi:hypothetical protein